MIAAAYPLLSEVVLWAFGQPNPFVISNTHPTLCGACIAFSPDRETLAVAFSVPSFVGIDTSERPVFGVRFRNVTGPRSLPPPLLMPHNQRATSIAFSPTGTQLLAVCRGDAPLAAAGRFEFALRRFDVARRTQVATPIPIGTAVAFGEREASEFQPAVFSPDRTQVALPRIRCGRGTTESSVVLCNVTTGAIRVINPPGTNPHTNEVAFSPDGGTLATAGQDGKVTFWDTTNGREEQTFDWGVGPVYSVAFAPDGLRVACGGSEDIVIWDVDG
jgi:WD40 repeat protein